MQNNEVEKMLKEYFNEPIIDINSNPLKYWEGKMTSMGPMTKVRENFRILTCD